MENPEEKQETKAQDMNFEQALKRLEAVVQKLEDGEVPLEKAIEYFQEGMQLSKLCGKKLENVEQKIEMLLEENGELQKKPFEIGDEHEG